MDDKELLILAAKAAKSAGIELIIDPFGVMRDCTGFRHEMNIFAAPAWNPLNDDGDALRLLVATKTNISWLHSGRVCCIHNLWDSPDSIESSRENVPENTRRAIVRAAAEIGKSMP